MEGEGEGEAEVLGAHLVGALVEVEMEVVAAGRSAATGPPQKIGSDGTFPNISAPTSHPHKNPPTPQIPFDHYSTAYLFASLNILVHCTVYGDGIHNHLI